MTDRGAHASEDPQERATRLANEMLAPFDKDDEIRAIAFCYPGNNRGGVGLHGYGMEPEEIERAVADALQSLDALMQTVGKTLMVTEVGRG